MVNIIIAIVLALLRIFGIRDEVFQAIAHLYMGMLITAYYYTGYKLYLYLIVALSVVETICFIVTKVNF